MKTEKIENFIDGIVLLLIAAAIVVSVLGSLGFITLLR
jgi:hypothetical protein